MKKRIFKRIKKKCPRYFGLGFLTLAILTILVFGFYEPYSKTFPVPSPSDASSPLYQDFHLIIPALDINAPVIADVNGADQDSYNKALESGVAQLKGSSKPGEGSNIFIFGHSSYYWYKPGDYKEVFRNLDDLKEGDEIILWFSGKEYHYKVSSKKTVSPYQVDVVSPTKKEQISLMTCVPPGTTLKRLIVVAKLVD